MSSYTTNAFVADGDFGEATREHPAMAFGEEVRGLTAGSVVILNDSKATKIFDSRDHRTIMEWITEDFSVVQPDGSRGKGNAQESFNNAKQVYDKLLTDHRHVPVSTIVVETKDGYKVMTHAMMCGNLLAVSALNPTKVSAPDGSKWDLTVPVFGELDLVKDANAKHHGLLVRQVRFVIDQNEILKGVQARGLSIPSFLQK